MYVSPRSRLIRELLQTHDSPTLIASMAKELGVWTTPHQVAAIKRLVRKNAKASESNEHQSETENADTEGQHEPIAAPNDVTKSNSMTNGDHEHGLMLAFDLVASNGETRTRGLIALAELVIRKVRSRV